MTVSWIPKDGERLWVYWSGVQVWGTVDGETFDDERPLDQWSHFEVTFDQPQLCDCPTNCGTYWPAELYPLFRIHPAIDEPTEMDPDKAGMRHTYLKDIQF